MLKFEIHGALKNINIDCITPFLISPTYILLGLKCTEINKASLNIQK